MIIGGGPGGYTAALKAAGSGLKTVLFEKDKIGGTCLNRGCIPTKSLIESSRYYRNAGNGELFGINAEGLSFDYAKVEARRDETVEKLRDGIEKRLKAAKVDVIKGQARIISKDQISCNDEIYEGDNIVIAAGSCVSKPPIEGIEHCITSDDILERNFALPDRMIIIGGGVIGSEIADALSAFGTQITILEMAERLLPAMDKELGQRLGMFFKKRGIEVCTSVKVLKIEKQEGRKTVYYSDRNGNERTVEADEVLITAGRKANVTDLCGPEFTLEINRGIVNKDGRTSYDNIYVIGDAGEGNIQLAHFAEAQGENVIDMILKKDLTNDLSVIPSCVYTDPEIASVGAGEEQLKAQAIEYKVSKYLTGANGRCLIENAESGFVKLITVNDVIVGGQIISPHATELIGELAIAVEKKMTLSELAEVVHPHPTISEMIWEAAK